MVITQSNQASSSLLVVSKDTPTSDGMSSVCDSLSTLTFSTEGYPSTTSSTCSLEDAWECHERTPSSSSLPSPLIATPLSVPPPSSSSNHQSWKSSGSKEEDGSCLSAGSPRQQQVGSGDESCSEEDERDGILGCSGSSDNRDSNIQRGKTREKKSYCHDVNHENNSQCSGRSSGCWNTFPRNFQFSDSVVSQASNQPSNSGAHTKPNSLVKPDLTGCSKKDETPMLEGNTMNSIEYFSLNHSRSRKSEPSRALLKKKSTHDVHRAFSEPNEVVQ